MITKQITRRTFGFGKSSAHMGKGSSWEQYKRNQGKFGKDRDDTYRAAYEAEKKQKVETKLNWGIKNRWE